MPYSSSDGRRNGVPRRSQRRTSDSRGINHGPVTSQGRRPAQARGGSASQYRSSRSYRSVNGRNRGYDLKQHNIRFNERRGSAFSRILSNPRALVFLVVSIILLVMAVMGISSCVRGCVNKGNEASSEGTALSATLSAEVSEKLTARLEQDELMTKIAAGTEQINDERLIELALAEPDAVAFVAALTAEEGAPTGAQPYGSEASRGTYPKLYNWDPRWGYVTFGDGLMAITGSGPTAFATAIIGLTGATKTTPADLATLAVEQKQTDNTYGFTTTFVQSQAPKLGLTCSEFSPSGDNLTDVVESGTVVLAQMKAGSFGDTPHWLLVVGENLDGSVNINDPTSSANTSKPWDPATVAASAQSFWALAMDDGKGTKDGTGSDSASDKSTTTSEADTEETADSYE